MAQNELEGSRRIESVDSPDDDDVETLSRDEIFHVLQCRRRRLVLKYLQEHEGTAVMSDIAEHIAAEEHDTTVQALRSQERQRVYIALYQSHLPKLDNVGVIEYEQNRGSVDPTELMDEFEPYLDEEPSLRADDADTDDTESVDASQNPATTVNPTDSPSADGDQGSQSDSKWGRRYLYASGGSLVLLVGSMLNAPLMSFFSGSVLATLVSVMFSMLATGQYVTDRLSLQSGAAVADTQ